MRRHNAQIVQQLFFQHCCCGNTITTAARNGSSSSSRNNSRFVLAVIALASVFIITIEIIDKIHYDDGLWIRLLGRDHVGIVNNQWCEAVNADVNRFIMEPSNARSDYFFILIGAWMIVYGIRDFKRLNLTEINPPVTEIVMTYDIVPAHLDDIIATNTHNAEHDTEVGLDRSSTQAVTFTNDDIKNPLLQYPQLSIGNGIFNIMHGLGSFFYHSCECNTWFASEADGAGMLAVVSFPMFYTISQLFITSTSRSDLVKNNVLATIPLLGQGILWLMAILNKVDANPVFQKIFYVDAALIPLVWLYFKFWNNRRSTRKHKLLAWLPIISLALFAVGYGAWILDKKKIWCFRGPKYITWMRGHALWHLLSAGSLFCMYMYFRTESITISVQNSIKLRASSKISRAV
mmetsp:Transcript_995/g.1579  ORF Transcript_995/g.1579 Transcript_995/m.1579 type:complete len:404 (+) Transcript_995:158-1369(+)